MENNKEYLTLSIIIWIENVIIGVLCTVLVIASTVAVVSRIDVMYKPTSEGDYVLDLLQDEFPRLIRHSRRDEAKGFGEREGMAEYYAIVKYYEAATYYEAYRRVGDMESAGRAREAMEQAAGEMGVLSPAKTTIDELFGWEETYP